VLTVLLSVDSLTERRLREGSDGDEHKHAGELGNNQAEHDDVHPASFRTQILGLRCGERISLDTDSP
jgi:hypothetical protein